ncbi:MAG: hypothetical protein IJO29_01005 [Oscillospiraceae bacterium]|nr:hypothetical protein [Oscillospiraceae bacterium]
MKKLFALIISSMLIFGASCSEKSTDSSSESAPKTDSASSSSIAPIDYDSLEVVRWESDRITYDNIDELDRYGDIAVIGTFTDNSTTVSDFDKINGFEQEVLTNIYSYNTIKVEKVLKGDVNVGDEITAIQDCGIHDGKLVTFSDMEPMKKGDQWIFFLSYDSTYEGYWCMGDYNGRFPVPKTQTATLSRTVTADSKAQLEGEIEKMTNEDFGVYDDVSPMRELYYDVITHYDCTLQ